jgi:hypothetical protein
MRMQSRAGEDPIMLFGDLQRAIVCAGACPATDGKNSFQAAFASASKHLRAVRIEFVAFQMGVGIDVHGSRRYFSLAPTGTSSRNPASTGLPSSPTEAATIMPFDSSPRNLRG